MIVASMSINVLSYGIILRFINISLCYHKLELKVDFFFFFFFWGGGLILEFSMSIPPRTISQKNKINIQLL